MLALGTHAPAFRLENIDEKRVRIEDFRRAKVLCVVFMCNHCPYVIHILDELLAVAREYQEHDVAFVAINSNDIEKYPDDSPSNMARLWREKAFPFPYLFDETQAIATAYRAACTPDFFVFDADRRLAYRGRFDASRPGNKEPVTGADLRRALELALKGQRIPEREQMPSLGCNIKWKPGNAPAYFAS
jgi:peroxiredoxin